MVSRLALGTMTWGRETGEDDAATQLRAYVDAGGTLLLRLPDRYPEEDGPEVLAASGPSHEDLREPAKAAIAGLGLDDALAEAGRDLAHLNGGQQGTVVIHAIDTNGQHRVAAHKPDGPLHYWLWTPEMAKPERRDVAVL